MNILSEKKWIDETWYKIEKKMTRVAGRSFNKIPYTSKNGVHDNMCDKEIAWWTNGFWPGLMWLMYSYNRNEEYRKTAENAEKLMDKAFENFDKLHHDVGFMWHIMSGANYRLTGNKKSRTRNLYAAAILASRYNIDGRFIRAWPNWDAEDHAGWTIIDCMMNIPLLYWASIETKDDRYKKVAIAHADMCLRDHIRPDGRVNHIVSHNCDTGEVIEVLTGQGYAADSCWTRGASWAIYGMIISYIHTEKKEYLDAAILCADYFAKKIAEYKYKNPVDFDQPAEPVYYDTTGGLCAACGMIEIAKYVEKEKAEYYIDTALKILKATDENFCDYDENTDSLVLYGTEYYHDEEKKGIHIPIIYGDFFFVEALLKLKGNDFLIW